MSKLREFRIKCGLTQTELSEMIGCSYVTVSHLENGYAIPGERIMRNIISFTKGKVTADDFYREAIREVKKK